MFFLVFFLIGFLVYGQTWFFDFLYIDDSLLIIDRFNVISEFSNIFLAFKKDVFLQSSIVGYYRPILTLSFMIDANIGGLSPIVYHTSNIIFHIIAASLLFIFL